MNIEERRKNRYKVFNEKINSFHDCKQRQEIDRAEKWDKAPVAPPEIEKSCQFFYSEHYPYNDGFFSDWNEFFDAWTEKHEPEDEKPEFVWITKSIKMHMDAYDIVESATDYLYEDAIDNISTESIEELQNYLDKWCDNCNIGNTYYPSYEYKVKIPWSRY